MKRQAPTLAEVFNNPIVIPVLDPIVHTEANHYTCDDPECPCQDDYEEYWQPFRDRTADQDRNATTKCADGTWW